MLGFNKPDVHSVLLIDIASTSVGIGLSGIRDKSLPELIFTARIPFAHRVDFDMKHIEGAMFFALRDVIRTVFREGVPLLKRSNFPGSINHCIISFSSPWFTSQLGGSESSFVSSLRERYIDPMEIFESEKGLHGATQSKLIKKIEDEVLRTFGIKEGIGVQSFSVVFSKVLEHAFEGLEPAMFVDVGGHMSDVLTLNKGSYQGYYSVPVGSLHMNDRSLEWNTFWNNLLQEHPEEFTTGNIFLIADNYDLARKALMDAIPLSHIMPFSRDNEFIKEMIHAYEKGSASERIAILATFSNLFH